MGLPFRVASASAEEFDLWLRVAWLPRVDSACAPALLEDPWLKIAADVADAELTLETLAEFTDSEVGIVRGAEGGAEADGGAGSEKAKKET